MKKKKEKVEITLNFTEGVQNSEEGYFEGGVQDPKFLKELFFWVKTNESFNFEEDKFISDGFQINLSGSRRALREFGTYLIGLSRHEAQDKDYHDHFDELGKIKGEQKCEIIVHSSERMDLSRKNKSKKG